MRLIVLVHCSDGDVMVSARPQAGTLFFIFWGGGGHSHFLEAFLRIQIEVLWRWQGG